MSDESVRHHIAQLTAFATTGAVTTTQEVISVIRVEIERADPNVVAEETLCLMAQVTARAVEASGVEAAASVSPALLELPFLYRDYIIGGAVIDDSEASVEVDEGVYVRLERARQFYSAHFPPHQFPGRRALADKMALWMGRVSPPRLPESPVERLNRLGLVDRVAVHATLVLEYARQVSGGASTGG